MNEITNDDWALAGIVMAVSDRTRGDVADVLRSKTYAENASRGRADGVREIARSDVLRGEEAKRLERVADNIERKLKADGGELSRSALRRTINRRDRSYFDAAEELLIESGRIEKLPADHNGPSGFLLRLAGQGSGR
jgi:hypothetical protein